ncbi:MAG: AgmX/PglI C-terminal domain-containing protein [Calditrichaceae bacterium]
MENRTIESEKNNFNKDFGLNFRDHFERRILLFFGIASLVILLQIIIVANLDYSDLTVQNKDLILDKYKRLVTELITDYDKPDHNKKMISSGLELEIPKKPMAVTKRSERIDRRRTTDSLMAKQGVLNPDLQTDIYADLPDFEDTAPDDILENIRVIELSQKESALGPRSLSQRDINNYEINDIDEPLQHLYNYVIHRQGNAYINPTDELLKEDEPEIGYRDPDEIQKVISDYQPMIEHCYRKALMNNAGTRGYVKVRFQISYEGYVIPESIRIINSTLKNRKIEQCIKKYIKRWRNFEELDETMGIARVTQKFVFN